MTYQPEATRPESVNQPLHPREGKLPISAIIITNKNDKRFKQALASVQFCSQVLIGDNQSQNDWQKLAKQYHFQIVSLKGKIYDFSFVRNKLSQQAKYNWVLFLDSDEKFPKQSRAKQIIANAVRSSENNETPPAFSLKRTDVYQGQKISFGEAGSQSFIRLFNKRYYSYSRMVHEVVTADLGKKKIIKLPLTIIHQAHRNVIEFLETINHYAYLEAKYRTTLTEKTNDKPSKFKIGLQLFLFPKAKFVLNYVVKLGFLDGRAGFIYASMMSLHSLLVRVYWWELLFLNNNQN